jgi:hypothetical protein
MSRVLNRPGAGERESGLYNNVTMFHLSNSYDWYLPYNLDKSTPIFVHVWGAGGGSGTHTTSGNGYGGGGGGLAVKTIRYQELLDASISGQDGKKYIELTVGEGAKTNTGVGGTSSFGSIISATGGNSGLNSSDNEGLEVLGAGGLGLGGDRNRRGGRGGVGSLNSSSGNGGGGGSAPAPYGYTDGFQGGFATTRGGAGGAGIGGVGGRGGPTGQGGGGGGSARPGSPLVQDNPSIQTPNPGGAGIMQSASIGYTQNSPNSGAGDNTGDGFILTPNLIVFGGAGGVGGKEHTSSSTGVPGHGGPGAGGGGINRYTSSSSGAQYIKAGNGGLLGGGGGAAQYNIAGDGGNAGGGGGAGYDYGTGRGHGYGGDGLIIIQYRTW